ncbi:hypothetical protein ATANTOWER_007094 [Ataeniobius toweri]|uniref:Uncharacterized protein n=1 Tax=Ataeniobius toweri TaxID=208326 RepID=A0ABU7APZ0_9TELE|nr:hypothetical protein [Ataeniobius toweri]
MKFLSLQSDGGAGVYWTVGGRWATRKEPLHDHRKHATFIQKQGQPDVHGTITANLALHEFFTTTRIAYWSVFALVIVSRNRDSSQDIQHFRLSPQCTSCLLCSFSEGQTPPSAGRLLKAYCESITTPHSRPTSINPDPCLFHPDLVCFVIPGCSGEKLITDVDKTWDEQKQWGRLGFGGLTEHFIAIRIILCLALIF